jgi:hypothetical protein
MIQLSGGHCKVIMNIVLLILDCSSYSLMTFKFLERIFLKQATKFEIGGNKVRGEKVRNDFRTDFRDIVRTKKEALNGLRGGGGGI